MVLNFSVIDFFRNVFGLRTAESEVVAAGRSFAHLADIAQLTPEAALARLESSGEGLLERESVERLERYGPNEVAHERKKHPLRRLLELFANPLPLLLLVLALFADLTGEVRGAIVITLMVVLSVLLSFVQEFRSSRAAERLRAMVHTTVTVLRKDLRKGIPDEVTRHFPVRLQYRESGEGRASARAARPRRRGRVVGRRHDSRRCEGDQRQGPLRQPGGADRRVAAGGEIPWARRPRWRRRWNCRTSPSWAATLSAEPRRRSSLPRAARPTSARWPAR